MFICNLLCAVVDRTCYFLMVSNKLLLLTCMSVIISAKEVIILLALGFCFVFSLVSRITQNVLDQLSQNLV